MLRIENGDTVDHSMDVFLVSAFFAMMVRPGVIVGIVEKVLMLQSSEEGSGIGVFGELGPIGELFFVNEFLFELHGGFLVLNYNCLWE